MTIPQAKKLYIEAGGPCDHAESEWQDICKEIEAVVAAYSDRAGGKLILWWGCWDKQYTATGFARRVREAAKQSHLTREQVGVECGCK